MKIVQITDTHLGAPDEKICGLYPIDRLKACVADIESNHADAAFCVFSGDLSDAGKPEAYQALSEVLSPLTPHVIMMVGNHDHRENLRNVFPDLPSDANGFLQWRLKCEEGDFLFLDTVDQGNHIGLYCRDRRRWLSDRLDESEGRPVFLFMHHPPFDVGLPDLDAIGLRERKAFAEILAGYNNIRHLFFGHAHRPIAGSWQGIPFTSLRGTNHGVALDFTEIGYISDNHEPPAYAIILVDEDKVVVHLHDFLDQTKTVMDDAGNWVNANTGKKAEGY